MRESSRAWKMLILSRVLERRDSDSMISGGGRPEAMGQHGIGDIDSQGFWMGVFRDHYARFNGRLLFLFGDLRYLCAKRPRQKYLHPT
jgi:hypothetical protein